MIKEANISEYRSKKDQQEINIIEFTNLSEIITILESFDLLNKPYGSLSAPYYKYFEIGYINKNGIYTGYVDNHNMIYVKISKEPSIIDRIRYFHKLEITQSGDTYNIVAIAQVSSESVWYVCDLTELEEVITKIFLSVKK